MLPKIGCTPKGSYRNTAFQEGFWEGSGKGSEEGFWGRVLRRGSAMGFIVKRILRIRARSGTEICNFGAPSPLEAPLDFLLFLSSIYVQFSKTSPLKSGESSEKSSGEHRVKRCLPEKWYSLNQGQHWVYLAFGFLFPSFTVDFGRRSGWFSREILGFKAFPGVLLADFCAKPPDIAEILRYIAYSDNILVP